MWYFSRVTSTDWSFRGRFHDRLKPSISTHVAVYGDAQMISQDEASQLEATFSLTKDTSVTGGRRTSQSNHVSYLSGLRVVSMPNNLFAFPPL